MSNETKKSVDVAGDFALISVPKEQRKSFASIMWVNAGYSINLGCIATGAALAATMPLDQLFIAFAIGTALLAIVGIAIGAIGAKYGVSSSVLSRQSFGRYGSWLVGFVLAVSLGIGWFGWQVGFFANTIHALVPNSWLTTPTVACIWGGALMILTATIGFKAMGILSFITVPMMITFFAFGIITAITQSGISFAQLIADSQVASGTPLSVGITAVVGATAAGCIGIADITRYAKTPKQAAASGTIGYLGGALFCEIAGALIVVVSRRLSSGATSDLIAAMLTLGLGAGSLLVLILAQWTTNDNNLYSGSLGLTNIIKVKKSIAAIVMGTIGIIIAILGIQDYFVPFLNVLGTVLPPIGGIILAHHMVVRPLLKEDFSFLPGEKYSGVNVITIIVTLGSAALSWFWKTSIPAAVIGLVASFVAYSIMSLLCNKLGIKYKFGEYTLTDSGY
jgi:cytosine permease